MFVSMHIIHLLSVILWIGGLAFVTFNVFPAIYRETDSLKKVLLFQRIEHRFSAQARILSLLTGITGIAMVYIGNWWVWLTGDGLSTLKGMSLLFMIIMWAFWTVLLFGLEPIIIRKMLKKYELNHDKYEIDDVFKRVNILHYVLLTLTLIACAGGAMFAHN